MWYIQIFWWFLPVWLNWQFGLLFEISLTQTTITPRLSMSFTTSTNLLFGFPLFLLPVSFIFNISSISTILPLQMPKPSQSCHSKAKICEYICVISLLLLFVIHILCFHRPTFNVFYLSLWRCVTKFTFFRHGLKAALTGVTLCWRVVPLAPEVFISSRLRGQKASPLTSIDAGLQTRKYFHVRGKVCFRYNVCVDRCSAFFSWLSLEQSLTSESQLTCLVTR